MTVQEATSDLTLDFTEPLTFPAPDHRLRRFQPRLTLNLDDTLTRRRLPVFSLFSPDLPSSGFAVPSRRRAKQPTGCQPEGRPPRGRACRPLGRRNESRWATKRRLGWVKFRPLMWFKSQMKVKLREQLDLLTVVKKESQLDSGKTTEATSHGSHTFTTFGLLMHFYLSF